MPAEELVEYLKNGDPRLLAWQQEAGQYLKIAIRNIEAIFDPDTVVIGGGLPPELMEGLIAATTPLLPSMIHRHASSLPRLMRAEHAAELPALGAAALPLALLVQPGMLNANMPASSERTHQQINPALEILGVYLTQIDPAG